MLEVICTMHCSGLYSHTHLCFLPGPMEAGHHWEPLGTIRLQRSAGEDHSPDHGFLQQSGSDLLPCARSLKPFSRAGFEVWVIDPHSSPFLIQESFLLVMNSFMIFFKLSICVWKRENFEYEQKGQQEGT